MEPILEVAQDGITRRDWISCVIGTAAAATLAGCGALSGTARGKPRVVRVESPSVWVGERRDPVVIAKMLERGVTLLTGAENGAAAWRRILTPGMRVGLKINLLGRPLLVTSLELTQAVAAAVIAAGTRPSDVIVWDRHAHHFGPTPYSPGRGPLGERVVAGGDYDPSKTLHGSGGAAPLDRVVTEQTDITINLPLLKDHSVAGVTLSLKNIALGCYNEHPRAHDGNCDPFIAEAYAHFLTVHRIPLIVLDATKGCFDQGPQPSTLDVTWNENAIYLATDPVALDVICRRVILDKRQAHGLSDKLSQSRHIDTAAQRGLGVGNPAAIDLVKVRL